MEEQNGIIIVRNPIQPIYDREILALQLELSIGKTADRAEYLFRRIFSLDIDEHGDIYVLDNGSATVIVFSPVGEFLRAFGSRGQGPGEMQSPQLIQVINNRELSIYDPMTRRFLIFSLHGEYLRQISTARLMNPIEPIKWDSEGNLIAFIIPPPDSGAIALEKMDENLECITKIAIEEQDSSYLSREYKMIKPSICCGVFEDGSLVWGDSKKYELRVVNADGKLTKIIVRSSKPIKVSDKAKRELRERFSRLSVSKAGFKPIFPKYYPYFQDISVDDEGRVFVLTYEAAGEDKRYFYSDIFDPEGRYIAKTQMSLRARGLFWKKGKLYSIERDAEGFDIVNRYSARWN
jgi:hypothetical protein